MGYDMDDVFRVIEAFAIVIGVFATIGSAIILVDKIMDIVHKYKAKAEAPNKLQDANIDELHNKLIRIDEQIGLINLKFSKHDELLDKDKKRLDKLEQGNKILLKASSNMIHSIREGNNLHGLEESDKDLNEFIWK